MILSESQAEAMEQRRGVFVDPITVQFNCESCNPENEVWRNIPDYWIIESVALVREQE